MLTLNVFEYCIVLYMLAENVHEIEQYHRPLVKVYLKLSIV